MGSPNAGKAKMEKFVRVEGPTIKKTAKNVGRSGGGPRPPAPRGGSKGSSLKMK